MYRFYRGTVILLLWLFYIHLVDQIPSPVSGMAHSSLYCPKSNTHISPGCVTFPLWVPASIRFSWYLWKRFMTCGDLMRILFHIIFRKLCPTPILYWRESSRSTNTSSFSIITSLFCDVCDVDSIYGPSSWAGICFRTLPASMAHCPLPFWSIFYEDHSSCQEIFEDYNYSQVLLLSPLLRIRRCNGHPNTLNLLMLGLFPHNT